MIWYPWLRVPFEQLVGQYQSGRGHHAVLIIALPEMGQDTLMYALVRWLMCRHPEGTKSCGYCHGCELMQAGTHPDSYQLLPEKGKTMLGIDAVRELTDKLSGRAQLGGNKVVRLPDAGRLTEAAANALLKTLEEPPENTWFFLTCQDPARVPATLRSRCLSCHLAPPDEAVATHWLSRQGTFHTDQQLAALRLSGGSPGAALQLLEPAVMARRTQLITHLMTACKKGNMLGLLADLHHDDAPRSLHWLTSLLLDAAKHQRGIAGTWVNQDAGPLIAVLAATLSPAKIQALQHSLLQCREQLLTVSGVNRELLLTEQLLYWERLADSAVTVPQSFL